MGRPDWRWKSGVKKIFSDQGLNMQEGERLAQDRVNWNDVLQRGHPATSGLYTSM